jgi:hypothetical protein
MMKTTRTAGLVLMAVAALAGCAQDGAETVSPGRNLVLTLREANRKVDALHAREGVVTDATLRSILDPVTRADGRVMRELRDWQAAPPSEAVLASEMDWLRIAKLEHERLTAGLGLDTSEAQALYDGEDCGSGCDCGSGSGSDTGSGSGSDTGSDTGSGSGSSIPSLDTAFDDPAPYGPVAEACEKACGEVAITCVVGCSIPHIDIPCLAGCAARYDDCVCLCRKIPY